MDASTKSVTEWIAELKNGNEDAAEQIWNRYFTKLLLVANRYLRDSPRGLGDEEDVVLDAMKSVFARANEFPNLKDRHNLWPLLVQITTRKAQKLREKEQAQKRGGGKVQQESIIVSRDSSNGDGFDHVAGSSPSPAILAELSDTLNTLVHDLTTIEIELIHRKLEGFSNREIARMLDLHPRTIDRKIERFRADWTERLKD